MKVATFEFEHMSLIFKTFAGEQKVIFIDWVGNAISYSLDEFSKVMELVIERRKSRALAVEGKEEWV